MRPTKGEEEALERVMGVNIPTWREVSGIQTPSRVAAGGGLLHMTDLIPSGQKVSPPTASPLTFVRSGDRQAAPLYSAPETLDPLIERCNSGQVVMRDAGDLVASVYGMNLEHMPELAWRQGYAWGLALMLASAVGPFATFKLRGWL